MMSGLMLTLGILVLLAAVVVVELVRRRRLKERYAAIWLAFGMSILFAMIVPESVTVVAGWLGFIVPSNLVLVGGLVVLSFVALQLSVELGKLRDMLERLATEIALVGVDAPTRDSPANSRPSTGSDMNRADDPSQ